MLFGCMLICIWFSLKEFHEDGIKYWNRQIPQLMCEMKKYLPMNFFNAQEYYLIHQVEEIEMCGLVQTRSTWMVERHLKSLKALVRQIASLEGSMVEGYMVYESMVYISQYIPTIETSMHVDHIWDVNPIKIYEGEHLLGKGRMKKVRGN